MNAQEQIQAADFAAEMISSGISPEALVNVIYNFDFYQGLLGLSSPLPPDSDLSGLTNQYYTLKELVRLGMLQHKVEALDLYAEKLESEENRQIRQWLNSGESHKVAEALVALSGAYAGYPAVSYCRKPRSQW